MFDKISIQSTHVNNSFFNEKKMNQKDQLENDQTPDFAAGVGGLAREEENGGGYLTPEPSVVIDMQEDEGTEGGAEDSGNNSYLNYPPIGSPLLPMVVRLQADPEEQKKNEKMRKIQIGISIAILVIFLLSFLSSVGRAGALESMQNSPHKKVTKNPTKFADIQGCDEIKSELMQIVEFLKNPEKYQKFGAIMPRGYLLAGPPGVGKTMLAKAVAGEADVAFLSTSGSEFEQVYVGIGASRVRNLFAEARSYGKAVIFIDEIDAVAGKRDGLNDHGSMRQTMNQLLVEMDGFADNSGIVVLAATNTPNSLDKAILRPGRFDKTLNISPPDIAGREKIITSLFAKIPKDKLATDVTAKQLAIMTIGFTGADLANLVNRAKLFAAVDSGAKTITYLHFKNALDYINFGPERKMVMSPEERKMTAYHEAGHAIVGLASSPHAFPVQYATIVPRSNALGLVSSSPDSDIYSMSYEMLKASLDRSLGGFLAEQKFNGGNIDKVSTGASSDFEQANMTAKQIVHAGFGKRCGFFQPMTDIKLTSENAKKDFEDDMKDVLQESHNRTKAILDKYEVAWKALANALLEKESLSRKEIEDIYNTNKPSA